MTLSRRYRTVEDSRKQNSVLDLSFVHIIYVIVIFIAIFIVIIIINMCISVPKVIIIFDILAAFIYFS